MAVKGHALCWDVASPKWLESLGTCRLREALYRHIRTTVGHFYGRCVSWDVVNEALNHAKQDCSGNLADNVFLRKLGPSYIDDCFRVAHQVDPNVKLFYNDDKVEGAGLPDGRSDKADAMVKLLRGMKDRGVPVHGVGLQAHLDSCGKGFRRTPTPHSIRRNIRRLGEMGLEVNISEMDVRVRKLPHTIDAFQAQREIYRDILTAAFAEPSFSGVTFWGVSDVHSWVHNFYGEDDPLLWDRGYRRKPAWTGVMEALQTLNTGRVFPRDEGAKLSGTPGSGSNQSIRSAADIEPEASWGRKWIPKELPQDKGWGC
ncbi:unnamed protein product [Choristocarpus tenellus]